MALTPIDQALAVILADLQANTQTEVILLQALAGRVLAQDLHSSIDIPLWDNSAMDGYALNSSEPKSLDSLAISQTVYAGQYPQALQASTCARIFTGAPIPSGADAVVMQENVTVTDTGVLINEAVRQGQHIRRQGQDMQQGQLLYEKGHCLSRADLSVLAAVGLASALVYTRLKVALLSSGDELVAPGQPLALGQIYNSNQILLVGMLKDAGCDIVETLTIPDNLDATLAALNQAAQADIVVSTGGVSVGEADYLKAGLAQLGQVQQWKMAIKPGKPVVYGRIAGTPFFGLPGNPSSAFVTFHVILKPYLQAMQHRGSVQAACYAKADFDCLKAGSRREYLRVRLYSDGYEQRVCLYPNQSSGVVMSTAWANALAIVPEQMTFEKGAVIEVLPL